VSYLIVNKTAISIKETVRIQSTTKSPLLSYFGETMNGASTIRAFKRCDDFIQTNNKFLNDNILAMQVSSGVTSWFSIRVDMIAVLLILVLSITCVITRESTDPIILSILMSYVLTIQSCLTATL
jgi:ABC-type multidrug transport system fused ATPase/permease subunit